MSIKTDCFGIVHEKHCKQPQWRTRMQRGQSIQYCMNCRVEWKRTEPQTPLRPTRGYK